MSEYQFEDRTFTSIRDLAEAYTASLFELGDDAFIIANDHTGLWDVWAWNDSNDMLVISHHAEWSKYDIEELTPVLALGVDF